MLRDLRVGFLAGPERAVVAPIVPEILNAGGSARISALGVFVDVMAGGAALRAAGEGWAVTSDLAVHATRAVTGGTIVGCARVLRAGKNTIVLEVDVAERSADGEGAETGSVVATSTLSFARIERRSGAPATNVDEALPYEFAGPEDGLRAPLFEALGIRVVEASRGEVEVPLVDYVRNSVGAMQGGGLLCVAEAAAEAWAGATHPSAGWVATDLVAHYLAMVKVGPIASRVRVMRTSADAALVRVDLVDRGADDRLLTVVNVSLGADPPS